MHEQTYDVTQGQNNTGKVNAYLVKFDAPLKSTFYNGTYTVVLHVTYKTPAGDPTEQTFNMQVQITGGKTPSSGGGGSGPTAVRKPVILIQNCMITPTEVSGGERASVAVSMSNVGNYDAKNIRVSLIPESDTITLNGDLNAKFFDALPIKGELDAGFDLAIAPGATEGAAVVTVQITYEDKYGGAYTEVCANKEIADHRVYLPYKNAGQHEKAGAFSDDPGISDRSINASMVRSQGDIRNPHHERDPMQSVRIPDSATDRTAGLFHWIQV